MDGRRWEVVSANLSSNERKIGGAVRTVVHLQGMFGVCGDGIPVHVVPRSGVALRAVPAVRDKHLVTKR